MPTNVEAPIDDRKLGGRVAGNLATLFAGRGLSTILSAVATILLARYLGRERLGEYGAIYAYIGLFVWLGTFGMESILSRESALRREMAGSILFTGSIISAVIGFLAAVVALLLAPYFDYNSGMVLLLALAMIDTLILIPFKLPGIVFQVDLRLWYPTAFGLFRQVLWLLALVILATGRASLFWVILARTLCGLAEAAVTFFFIWKRGLVPRPWKFLPDEAKMLLIQSSPLAISALAINVYNRIDQVMLHAMSTDKVLGGYVAAVNMTEVYSLFPVALMDSLFPVIARTADQPAAFTRYMRFSFRSLMAIAFGVCAVVTPVAGSLMLLVFGNKYANSGPILAAIIWSEVAVFFGIVLKMGLIVKNLQRFLAASTIAGAIVNVGLNFFFIPRWGAVGAAWATNISYTVASVLVYLVFRSSRSMAWLGIQTSIPGFILALGVAGIVFYTPLPFPAKFVLAILLYCAGAWLMGVVNRSDVERIRQLVSDGLVAMRLRAA
jgi:O-antigen/teichoic acid export membrane protein